MIYFLQHVAKCNKSEKILFNNFTVNEVFAWGELIFPEKKHKKGLEGNKKGVYLQPLNGTGVFPGC